MSSFDWADNELRAVYVAAKFGGQGVGTAILAALEKIAKSRGCTKLAMVSSLTAEPAQLRVDMKCLFRWLIGFTVKWLISPLDLIHEAEEPYSIIKVDTTLFILVEIRIT